jgi:hypothetical protein
MNGWEVNTKLVHQGWEGYLARLGECDQVLKPFSISLFNNIDQDEEFLVFFGGNGFSA